MKLLISHFFNEEFLLPWWLMHHREKFDHGILIDYHSTDRSVEICKNLVPDWEIVRSENTTFSGIMCDFEVMKHEQRFPNAWKLVLNTTEFLVGTQLDNVIKSLSANDKIGGRIQGAVMVDHFPEETPDPNKSLTSQKYHGAWEEDFNFDQLGQSWYSGSTRTRHLHNFTIGAYKPGRHESHLPKMINIQRQHLGIWWYAFSPWSSKTMERKLQIQSKIDKLDKKVGFGHQHVVERDKLNNRYEAMLPLTYPLELP